MLLACALLAASIQSSAAYQEAVSLYRRVELEKALVQLQQSLGEADGDGERAQVYAWIGLVEGQLGHLERARAALAQAITLDRAIELPAPAPPDVVAILDELRVEARRNGAADAARGPVVPAAAPEAERYPPWVLVTAAGGALMAGGAVSLIVGLDMVLRQAQEEDFQSRALARRDLGYAFYGVAGAAGGAGVVVLGVGMAMLVVDDGAE